jgi:predicted Zn-dependent protease
MREEQFKKLVADFPDSPMGHFSLGKLYLDEKRYSEAVTALSEAVRLDADYGAAWLALADAYLGLGNSAQAKTTLERARATKLGQRDANFIDDIEQRLTEL